MCFAIPKKIKSINTTFATIEDGTKVQLGNTKVKPGDYVMVYGNIIVETIDKNRALKMRTTIRTIEETN